MAVTVEDVRHVAGLARLGISEARAAALVTELNGILEHIAALSAVDTQAEVEVVGVGATGTPLRPDVGGNSDPLARRPEDFSPEVRDGLFIVPRLATHESSDVEGGAS